MEGLLTVMGASSGQQQAGRGQMERSESKGYREEEESEEEERVGGIETIEEEERRQSRLGQEQDEGSLPGLNRREEEKFEEDIYENQLFPSGQLGESGRIVKEKGENEGRDGEWGMRGKYRRLEGTAVEPIVLAEPGESSPREGLDNNDIQQRDSLDWHTIPANSSSTRKLGFKRSFPKLLEEEEDDGNSQRTERGSRKKKSSGGTLVDAVTILASAKMEGEDKKFEFLNRHIIQQGELRREELNLEREKLALKKEKAKAEQQKTELLLLQLRSSIKANTQHQPSTNSTSENFSTLF